MPRSMRSSLPAPHAWPLAGALALASFAPGCMPRRGAALEARVEASRRESQPERLVARAQSFARSGDYARATQYLEAALQQQGDADVIVPLLVSIEIKDQNYRAAAQHLEDRLRTHPSDVRARFVLASLMSALDRPKQAERELLGVLERAPRHAEATFALAVVYRDGMGDHQRADDYFRRYLAMEPEGRHRDEALSSTLTELPRR
jgi:tetratricopeptide (TPR) repeat protein